VTSLDESKVIDLLTDNLRHTDESVRRSFNSIVLVVVLLSLIVHGVFSAKTIDVPWLSISLDLWSAAILLAVLSYVMYIQYLFSLSEYFRIHMVLTSALSWRSEVLTALSVDSNAAKRLSSYRTHLLIPSSLINSVLQQLNYTVLAEIEEGRREKNRSGTPATVHHYLGRGWAFVRRWWVFVWLALLFFAPWFFVNPLYGDVVNHFNSNFADITDPLRASFYLFQLVVGSMFVGGMITLVGFMKAGN